MNQNTLLKRQISWKPLFYDRDNIMIGLYSTRWVNTHSYPQFFSGGNTHKKISEIKWMKGIKYSTNLKLQCDVTILVLGGADQFSGPRSPPLSAFGLSS